MFTPRPLYSRDYIGGWVGPGCGLDEVARRKIHIPAESQTPEHIIKDDIQILG
jgi:hypothetical protein